MNHIGISPRGAAIDAELVSIGPSDKCLEIVTRLHPGAYVRCFHPASADVSRVLYEIVDPRTKKAISEAYLIPAVAWECAAVKILLDIDPADVTKFVAARHSPDPSKQLLRCRNNSQLGQISESAIDEWWSTLLLDAKIKAFNLFYESFLRQPDAEERAQLAERADGSYA